MGDSKRRFVIPGEVITTGPYRPDQNVILEDKKIIATKVGISEIYDDSVKVIPLAGAYIPKSQDLVIGKIVSHSSLSWEANINSIYAGMLPASDVFGRNFQPDSDELTSKLAKGDLIAARIVNFDRSRDPLITIADRELGKIDSGELVKISPSKIPRLIGKQGTMIQAIEVATNATITIGQNGLIVVGCDNPDGLLKAKKAIRMVDEFAHMTNLTDKIKEMLESKSE